MRLKTMDVRARADAGEDLITPIIHIDDYGLVRACNFSAMTAIWKAADPLPDKASSG